MLFQWTLLRDSVCSHEIPILQAIRQIFNSEKLLLRQKTLLLPTVSFPRSLLVWCRKELKMYNFVSFIHTFNLNTIFSTTSTSTSTKLPQPLLKMHHVVIFLLLEVSFFNKFLNLFQLWVSGLLQLSLCLSLSIADCLLHVVPEGCMMLFIQLVSISCFYVHSTGRVENRQETKVDSNWWLRMIRTLNENQSKLYYVICVQS